MKNNIAKLLTEEYENIRANNKSYSLRAFSKKLGIPVSSLSEAMSGKRPVSDKMKKRVLNALCIHPNEYSKIDDYELISLEYFKVISDWHYYAILSLAEIKGFKGDPKWIANRLNITFKDAKMALDRLEKLDLLVKKGERYILKGSQYKTPTDIIDLSLKKHTLQTLELAKESLIRDDVELRDFSTVTMAVDPSKMVKMKKMIKTFRRKLSREFETGKKSEVYKLAIQLFPLSKVGENKC